MVNGKHTAVKILIVLISFFCIDGGKSFLVVGNNLQTILSHNHTNDIEVPHQHHIVNLNDEEKWLDSFRFDFTCFNDHPVKFLYTLKTPSQEFSDSIWQPPKFL